MNAVNEALEFTAEKIGTDPYWPLFSSIYSSTAFPQIYGRMEQSFGKKEGWEVKRSRFTFTLIRTGVCQFHFYKGRHSTKFKAQSQRQKAIVGGDLYGDLENLPSIIIQHFSDKLNTQLVGFHALFFKHGELVDDFDIMHKLRNTPLAIPEFSRPEPVDTEVMIRFTPKKAAILDAPKKRQRDR